MNSGPKKSSRIFRPFSTRRRAWRARSWSKAAELGLTAICIPEKFGGMEIGSRLRCDRRGASWGAMAPTPAGTPRIPASARCRCCISAPRSKSASICRSWRVWRCWQPTALTEPQAGSDALAARTRADLTPDGNALLLNGQKMWITNGGAADLLHRFRQGRRRQIHGVSGGAGLRRQERSRRTEDGA